eukprot:gene39629-53578_t
MPQSERYPNLSFLSVFQAEPVDLLWLYLPKISLNLPQKPINFHAIQGGAGLATGTETTARGGATVTAFTTIGATALKEEESFGEAEMAKLGFSAPARPRIRFHAYRLFGMHRQFFRLRPVQDRQGFRLLSGGARRHVRTRDARGGAAHPVLRQLGGMVAAPQRHDQPGQFLDRPHDQPAVPALGIDTVVPDQGCSRQHAGAASELLTAFAEQPVYVKACVAGASGAGIDVRYAADIDSRHQALRWLTGH